MGFFSSLFGGKSKKIIAVNPKELVRSSVENGVIYNVESIKENYFEVFFFETDELKIGFRDLATEARKKTLSFEKLAEFQIKIAGAVRSEEEKAKLKQEILNRETNSFYSLFFLDSKGLEKDWPEGFLVREENDSLIVKKSPKAKKEYTVRINLIYDIIFYTKEDLD